MYVRSDKENLCEQVNQPVIVKCYVQWQFIPIGDNNTYIIVKLIMTYRDVSLIRGDGFLVVVMFY